MSKFKLWELVRVTNPEPTVFDKVGRITGSPREDDFYRLLIEGRTFFIKGEWLTLADPDVHTVLDQMDAESAAELPAFMVGERVMVRGHVGSYGGRFGQVTGFEDDGAVEWLVRLDGNPVRVPFSEDELIHVDAPDTRGMVDVKSADPVNHPQHYGGDTTYETIKVIEAWGLGFSIGNCVKYLSRAGKKGPALEDLRKARFYLDREIAAAEAAQ